MYSFTIASWSLDTANTMLSKKIQFVRRAPSNRLQHTSTDAIMVNRDCVTSQYDLESASDMLAGALFTVVYFCCYCMHSSARLPLMI